MEKKKKREREETIMANDEKMRRKQPKAGQTRS